MSRSSAFIASVAALLTLGCGAVAEAQTPPHRHHYYHHHHYRRYRDSQDCLRFNKTTGTITGADVGGLLGHAVLGGPAGFVVGAAGGGLAGHELARNGRKHCR